MDVYLFIFVVKRKNLSDDRPMRASSVLPLLLLLALTVMAAAPPPGIAVKLTADADPDQVRAGHTRKKRMHRK
jgi:hypothetical protein